MASSEVSPQEEVAPAPAHTRVFSSARWRQIGLSTAYVLAAGPLGFGYLLLLIAALNVDLLYLTIRVLAAGSLALLYTAARLVFWLVRLSLRLVWAVTAAVFMWAWWCIVVLLRTVVAIFGVIIHPHRAWRHVMGTIRPQRDPLRRPRPPHTASGRVMVRLLQKSVERVARVCAAEVQRLRRRVVMDPWIITPLIWWRLAMWERRHTMGWLGIDLPPLGLPGSTLANQSPILSQLPLASLGYLLAKGPLGLLALLLITLAAIVALVLVTIAADDGSWLIGSSAMSGAIMIVPVAVYALYMLAYGSGRLAQRAFSPSAAVRRIIEAEAEAAQERLKAERAEQSRRDLIINVSHELRTPTASILAHVDSVLLALDADDRPVPPEMLKRYLGIVHREAERLNALVDDLLAVARAERDELQLVVAPVDAAAVIQEVYQALAPLARRERQVMLVHEEQPALPPLLADRQRLCQVLLNLVRNAITYTPAGGIVSITLQQVEGKWLRLSVADTGSGIAPADLERVFERFYRADASRARASGGFGLGLTIARDLVAAMGGTITAESVAGEGSCFHVTLPIAQGVGRPGASDTEKLA